MSEIKKSEERLKILEKIKEYESKGYFDKDVEDDPPTIPLLPNKINYLSNSLIDRMITKYAFRKAHQFINKLIEEKQFEITEIIGLENLNNLQSGAIFTCNHFNALDSFAMELVFEASQKSKENHKMYRVIREGNYTSYKGFYGLLMRHCHTLPLSSNMHTMKKMIKATNTLLTRGDYVLIYPEESMWWNYRKPKPLKKGGFHFAVKNNVPVLPIFITMTDSDVLDHDGFPVQKYTVHILEPIYPNQKLSNSENIENMMNKNYQVWKEVYEDFYHKPLIYNE